MHQAANNFQASVPPLGFIGYDARGQPLSWPQVRARMMLTLDALETSIAGSRPHLPAPVQRQLVVALREIRSGRAQLLLARDGTDFWSRTRGRTRPGQAGVRLRKRSRGSPLWRPARSRRRQHAVSLRDDVLARGDSEPVTRSSVLSDVPLIARGRFALWPMPCSPPKFAPRGAVVLRGASVVRAGCPASSTASAPTRSRSRCRRSSSAASSRRVPAPTRSSSSRSTGAAISRLPARSSATR